MNTAFFDDPVMGHPSRTTEDPDFPHSHIRTIPGTRATLACRCGATTRVFGLSWLSWVEEHRLCETTDIAAEPVSMA